MAKTKRRDEDDLAVELAKAVLEEAVTPDENGTAAIDEEGVTPAPEQQEGPEGASAPQPSEELLQSIRDRKDRRDAEEESTPANLDEANEVIRQQNEDIDALLSMLDKQQEAEKPAEEGNTDSEEGEETVVEENTDGEEEENTDCGDNVNQDEDGDEEEKAPTMNADSIDAIVRARASLMTLGERFNIDGLDSLPMEAAMKKVISVATPGIRLDSATELKGAFKVAVAVLNSQKDTNYQRQQMYSGTRADSAEKCEADAARTRMINSRK